IKSSIDKYYNKVRVFSPNLITKFELQSPNPIYGICTSRKQLDQKLLERAIHAGAKFLPNQEVQMVSPNQFNNRVTLPNMSIMAKYVIGADGVNSIVARSTNIGNPQNDQKYGLGLIAEIPFSRSEIHDFYGKSPMIYVFVRFGKLAGSGRLIPKQNSIIIELTGKFSRKEIMTKKFQEFIAHLQSQDLLPRELPLFKTELGVFPIDNAYKKTYSHRTFLIGDAAGFCSPLFNRGLYYALKSGDICADVCENLVNSKLQEFKVESGLYPMYYNHWQKSFGKELMIHKLLRKFFLSHELRTRKIIRWASQDKSVYHKFFQLFSGDEKFKYSSFQMRLEFFQNTLKDYAGKFEIPESDRKLVEE
ncbi:MAG: FAD-dependent monooxygenase, partial [Promethearchaeota archaeon]